MKSLWVTWGYPTNGSASGTFHQTMARALGKHGVEVELLVPTPVLPLPLVGRIAKNRWSVEAASDMPVTDQTIQVRHPRYPAFPGEARIGWPTADVQRVFTRVSQIPRADIVHAHGVYPFGVLGRKIADKWQVPLVVTLHGSDTNIYPQLNRAALRRFRGVLNSADCVTAVGRPLADRATDLSGRNVAVLPIGIDLSLFQRSNRGESRRDYGLSQEVTLVLFVGTLSREKGVETLLGLIRGWRDPRLRGLFVGDGPLRRAVESEPRAILMGQISNSDVPKVMSACDMLALPSRSEGTPTVIVEAGAIGLPVVATPIGGVPELLGGRRGFLSADLGAASFGTALRHALTDEAEARRRSTRLAQFVAAHYDVEANAENLAAKYEELVTESAAPSASDRSY